MGHGFADGSRLVVRHRLTLIATWIQSGPESLYVGVAGSPSVEWWNKSGTWSVYGGAGGGVGAIDSRGVSGGQGQDFTLNWFARGGLEHVVSRNMRLSVGAMFQHLSNGGQTDPNPGIDAVGLTLGWTNGSHDQIARGPFALLPVLSHPRFGKFFDAVDLRQWQRQQSPRSWPLIRTFSSIWLRTPRCRGRRWRRSVGVCPTRSFSFRRPSSTNSSSGTTIRLTG